MSRLFAPDIVLFRAVVPSSCDSKELIDRIRTRCQGRDWSGPRDLLIGTVSDDSFSGRRALAFQTPVRCMVFGQITPTNHGSRVTLHFGPRLLPVLVFWFIPLMLPIGRSYRFGVVALFVVTSAALFMIELRATKRLVQTLLK